MNSSSTSPATLPNALQFLAGGGEMGERIRRFDWAATPLGAPETWPQNLKMALRIMLTSRQPIWIGWGRELIYFYNDPYKAIIGGKHPRALGRPTTEVWSEIWNEIGPMLDTALRGEQGTYVEAQLLIMERNGYPEETYYTFSYSPIPNDDGTVGGIICANSDDTRRVMGERQLALLRDLAATAAHARDRDDACTRAGTALATNAYDLPFAMIYFADGDSATMRLKHAVGIHSGHAAAPALLSADEPGPWPVAQAIATQGMQLVTDLASRVDEALPSGPWKVAPSTAAILPLQSSGDAGHAGALVVGLNPYRLFDDDYRGFLGLVAGQIMAGISNAESYAAQRRRAEALAEIDRAKTLFFSNVSHEFRTPLTLMLAPLEDALNDAHDHTLPVTQRVRLETAHRNSLRLLKLVNSLLDFSRIEAGRTEASFDATDLGALTAELASNFESATRRAGLSLTVRCPGLGEPVYVDRDMWEKIVLNLLSNAFKFTFEGGITVAVQPSPDGRWAELSVRDTGVGIPAHELPRLFERFHRVEGQRSRSFEGSGIGLALVQELVKVHGGTIRVDSAVGRGSTFTVSIPFKAEHLSPDRMEGSRSRQSTALRAEVYVEEALRWLPEASGSTVVGEFVGSAADVAAAPRRDTKTAGSRVLVVDDNPDMRHYLERLLSTRWKVQTAADGVEALAAVRTEPPDLVLTDVMMPRLDGFGFLRELRADSKLRDLPVILLSARAGEDARVEGLDAGADDYLIKPFSARELIARVNANLDLSRVRREATRDLRESESRFRNMADHAPVMMWVTDATGMITYLNRGWYEFTGQTEQRGLGQGAWEALEPEDRVRTARTFHAANAGREAFRAEYRLRRADGEYRWALAAAAPRFGNDGEYLGYIGSVIDITERREAEQLLQHTNETLEARINTALAERAETEAQLRQAQKMEAIGKLTGGVAHDFNNVLQVITGNLQLLARDVTGNDRAAQRVQTAMTALARGTKLASQLLAFGRRQPLAPKVINLARLIRGIDDMLRRAIGEAIEIETVVAGGLWNTFVDAAQVENALLNMAINSRDAMAGHGRLTIEAGNAFLDDTYAMRHADVTSGQYVMLAVSDTGCGIPPDIIDRVFEPFFTTKPEGKGTGLGLSMVYGFVKQSGGHIKIYSEHGQGTTVRIYLPRARQVEDIETNVEVGPATGGTETVLAVEDDEEVRATVVDLLSELGYRVLKAKDAQSALAIIESGVPIDVLFTDVVMPGPLRSPELARKARERLPGVAVLFTSGYTENAIVHGGRLDEGIDLLSKPYSREALARKLRHVLRNQQQRNLAAAALAGKSAQTPAQRSLRVLLIEDDEEIRVVTAELLSHLGHSVQHVGGGEAAMLLIGQHEFDVIVTDLSLPGLSGDEIARQALQLQPHLRVVFASGYDRLPASKSSEFRGAIFLRKPYDEQSLAAAMSAVIK